MIVVAGLILNSKREALMTLRYPHKLRPNMWEYPGGKVDVGREALDEALRRELRGELGVDVDIGPLIGDVSLTMEVPFQWMLWACRPIGTPQAHEAAGMMYVKPEEAIARLPCTPTTYVIYPHVRAYLEGL